MKRVLFTTFSTSSLLLFVATTFLWIRSFVVADSWFDSRVDIPADEAEILRQNPRAIFAHNNAKWVQQDRVLCRGCASYYRLIYATRSSFSQTSPAMATRPLRHMWNGAAHLRSADPARIYF